MDCTRQVVLLSVIGLAAAAAGAQQPARQAYKHVDEQGRVTYSQTPPAKEAQKMALPPPRTTTTPLGHAYEREAMRRQEYENRRVQHERAQRERQETLEAERSKRVEELRGECLRNRGTDCDSPDTIRRMEAERGPSNYRPTAGRR
jgi:uncharacterized protein DUF4124